MAVPRAPVAQPPKTSAYLNRKIATTKTANFWGELTKMAEKAGKIETIDSKLNPLNPTGPATSLDMTKRTPSKPASVVRGSGGITSEMNGIKKREVRGSEFHEHVQEGRSMCAILQPDSIAQTRRAMTPKASTFIRSSNAIGCGQMYNSKEA